MEEKGDIFKLINHSHRLLDPTNAWNSRSRKIRKSNNEKSIAKK